MCPFSVNSKYRVWGLLINFIHRKFDSKHEKNVIKCNLSKNLQSMCYATACL